MNNIKTQFESDRLSFREITWDDLENIYALHRMSEIDEYNTLGIPKDIEETREVIRPSIEDQKNPKRKLFCWAIRHKKSKGFIGLAGLTLSAERFRMGEIYYNLAPDFWRAGLGTETAKALIAFGFETLKLHRINAGVATQNKRSIKLLEKVGMVREALHRKILPIRGEWIDNYEYAILEDDPR